MDSSPQSTSDAILIQKLEDHASLTNNNVLSEDEYLRGRTLLLKAKSELLELSPLSTIEHATLTEQISQLCVALAPHKRLPPGLLEHIFCFIVGAPRIPPLLSEAPWSLGQVCSSWRRLSRSLPHLWGTAYFYFEEFKNYSFTSPSFDLEKTIKELKCATELFPEVARLELIADDSIDVPTRDLIPYLRFITDMAWCAPEQEGLEIFPLGSLSRLITLDLYLDQDIACDSANDAVEGAITTYQHLFTEASQLQSLRLCSDSPCFLLAADIPWPQLRSIELGRNVLMNDVTRSAWLQLSRTFQCMKSLQKLTLDTADNQLISIVLSSDLPWHQLTSVRVLWRNTKQPSDIGEIMVALQKCSAVVKVDLATHADMLVEPTPSMVFTPMLFSDLRTLELSGPFTASTVLTLFSGMLRSLKMSRRVSLTLSHFYIIVQQCPHLQTLSLTISPGRLASSRPDGMVLSYLTRLLLNVDNGRFLPVGLKAPSLVDLTIRAEHGFDLLDSIVDFSVHSNSKLQRFICEPADDKVFPSTTRLKDLLSSLKYCTFANIDGFLLTTDVFEEIASASLLPCVLDLYMRTSEGEAFLGAIARRLERESMEGKSSLRSITMRHIRVKIPQAIRLQSQWEKLEKLYGVHYRYEPGS